MELEPSRILKPGDDLWDLCETIGESEHDENMPLTIRSIFLADIVDIESGYIIKEAIAPNIVLYSAYLAIISGAHPINNFDSIVVGTGSATPSNNQSGIMIPLTTGGTAYNVNYLPSADPSGPLTTTNPIIVGSYAWSFTSFWPSNSGNGQLTELSLWGNYIPSIAIPNFTGYLNRALFLDASGNPVSISKDASHYMRISANVNLVFKRA